MANSPLSGAEVIIECLKREGIDTIFGYPGGSAIPMFDAILDSNIKVVLTRHEQGATHMADGYARQTGKVGVALVTSGPGATNTFTGIYTALMDSSPIVVLAAQTTTPNLGKDAFQECDVLIAVLLGQAADCGALNGDAGFHEAVRLLPRHVAAVHPDERIQRFHGSGFLVIGNNGSAPRRNFQKALLHQFRKPGMNHRFADVGFFLQLALGGKAVSDLQLAGENLLFHLPYKKLFFCRDFNNADLHIIRLWSDQKAAILLILLVQTYYVNLFEQITSFHDEYIPCCAKVQEEFIKNRKEFVNSTELHLALP